MKGCVSSCSSSKLKFWINKSHEGPDEYEFDFISVEFSDGVKRFICKSEIVPEDYWPRMVYIFNMGMGMGMGMGDYEHVGSYEKNGDNIYIFI
jgi:hypothetical protein